MKNYEKIAFATIGFIKGLSVIASPFVKFFNCSYKCCIKIFRVGESDEEIVTEEEIKMMIDQGKKKKVLLKKGEKELLNNVFEFGDITVSEIMTHRRDIFAVDIHTGAEELLQEIQYEDYKYSRIPVYDETIDDIKGILYVKDILKNINKKILKIKTIMHDAYFCSSNQNDR